MTRAATADPDVDEVVLLTGFPRKLVTALTRHILARDARANIRLLVGDGDQSAAARLAASDPTRIRILRGDVAAMDLGLAGTEYQDLSNHVTTIHHVAHAPIREANKEETERINIGGTRSVLQLAADCKRMRRLCHWSACSVAGKRKGVVLEEDLDHGQSFHDFHEQTRFESEKLVRAAMHKLPITVLRPTVIVGDSRTGQCEEFDGAYSLMSLLVNGKHSIPVPIPGNANAPLHLVPMSFVVQAGSVLASDARAAGKTFQLADPNPLPARRVFELVAEVSQAKIAKRALPAGLAKTLLRTPGLEKLSRGPRAFLATVDQQIFFNTRGANELLHDQGIRCPPFDTYVAALVQDIKDRHTEPAAEARHEPTVDDPLDPV